MKLKIIFLISISGFVVASNSNGPTDEFADFWRRQEGRESARSQVILRPISPERPSDTDNARQNQQYVRNLEEHSLHQLLFLAQTLKAIIADHPAGIGMPKNVLKRDIQEQVRDGLMKEKDGVILLDLLNQLVLTAHEAPALRLSPIAQRTSGSLFREERDLFYGWLS